MCFTVNELTKVQLSQFKICIQLRLQNSVHHLQNLL